MLHCLFLLLVIASTAPATAQQHPNVIIFYVDDLGYGDPACYGGTTAPTPNVDRLAREGLRFTDGHSTAPTCTPSRYSLLTGRHAFRRQAEILPGDAPLLIDTARTTLADVLKAAGYATAVVGKWHLGLGDGELDWNGDIRPGPLEVGFDYAFLIPATGDRVPTVYIEDHRVVGLDPDDPLRVAYDGPIGDESLGTTHPEVLRYGADRQHSNAIVNGISRIGYQTGGSAAYWTDEDFPDTLGARAINFIRRYRREPFFLYYSFHDIHVPRLPHPRYRGMSDSGWRGDAIVQMDAMVGDVLDELDHLGLTENTLIIFTSDNGPVLNDGYSDDAVDLIGDHDPNGPFRGGKYSSFEAGTRVPTIVRWPERIAANQTSGALVSQLDLLPTLATLVGEETPTDLDGTDQRAAWLGQDTTGREVLIEEGSTLALRQGRWKYIRPIKRTFPWMLQPKGVEGGISPAPQLYDLRADPAETLNLAAAEPDVVAEMERLLTEMTAPPQGGLSLPSELIIDRAQYAEQLEGFWLGTCIANWTGLVTEMDKIGNVGEIQTGAFYTRADWGQPDQPSIWAEGIPSKLSATIDFVYPAPDSSWGADDDTDIEYIYQELLLRHDTVLLSGEQIRRGWLDHIRAGEENYLWVANQRAFDLMHEGMVPPATGDPANNPDYEMIDAQLTTEIFGLYAPGRPKVALRMAQLPIRTVAREESEAIARFYVAMFALASLTDTSQSMAERLRWMADRASAQLPIGTYPAAMYEYVRALYDKKLPWEAARDSIYQRYQVRGEDGYNLSSRGLYCNGCFAAGINFAASLVSLFYGEGDLKETIKIGTLAGWDSDNPTATWGGLLGFMLGKAGVEAVFGRRFSDRYHIHRTRIGFADEGMDDFPNMAQKGVRIVDRVVGSLLDGQVREGKWIIPLPD